MRCLTLENRDRINRAAFEKMEVLLGDRLTSAFSEKRQGEWVVRQAAKEAKAYKRRLVEDAVWDRGFELRTQRRVRYAPARKTARSAGQWPNPAGSAVAFTEDGLPALELLRG